MARGATKLMSKRALRFLVGLIIIGFGTSIVQLGNIQLIKGNEYKEKAEELYLGDTAVPALRGTIYDSNMHVLAQSASAWLVYIDPANITVSTKDKTEAQVASELEAKRRLIADGLAEILSEDAEKIFEKTKKNSRYEKIKGGVELALHDKVLDFVEKNSLYSCIGVQEDVTRYYPYGSLASTLIGFTGDQDVGREGLEAKYNDILTGVPGRIISAKSASSKNIPIEYTSVNEAQQGTSLVLTIDRTIQSKLETELEKAYESAQAKAAYGIVMDVKTGAILAMSNMPNYDLNNPFTVHSETENSRLALITDEEERKTAISASVKEQRKNSVITDSYEPGSVFKLVTLAAALEEDVVSESTTYTCVGGIQVPGHYIRCHKHEGHGTQTMQMGLMNSCNPFFISTGQKLGTETFYDYFEAFGFTEKTGIDLSGETQPRAGSAYHRREDFNVAQLSSYSFGQTFEVTPLQMITAVAAIANGGKLMTPYVVAKQLDEDGNVIAETQPTMKRQVVSESTAKRVLTMMEAVVSAGTGKNAYVAGYHVAGKTGTSQKLSVEGGENKYVASFSCVAPGDDPRVAILIAIDEPVGQRNGGQIAAPVAASLVEEIMGYLGVDPEYNEKEQNLIDIRTPSLVGRTVDDASDIAENQDLTVRVIGSGDNVIRQIPAYGQTMPQQGVVILYTDDREEETVTVPDFTGMSLSVARRSANNLGINIKISGNAFSGADILAYSQDIPKDTEVKYGEVVTVYFKSYSGLSDSLYG
ncbi:MAG: PASTA domain-containing protein [Clostridia bacterium]|nr:PASTA domain-containing protein [Clostridia bacterium]